MRTTKRKLANQTKKNYCGMTGTNKPALPISSSWRHPGVNFLNKTKTRNAHAEESPCWRCEQGRLPQSQRKVPSIRLRYTYSRVLGLNRYHIIACGIWTEQYVIIVQRGTAKLILRHLSRGKKQMSCRSRSFAQKTRNCGMLL